MECDATAALTEEYTVAGGTSTRAREFVWGRRFTEPVALIDWTPAGAVGAGTAEPLDYLRSALGSVVALTPNTRIREENDVSRAAPDGRCE